MSQGSDPRAEALAAFEAAVARHYRWNLGAHLLYGLFGTTGWRLITAPTFVPDYIYRLGGSNLIVGALLFCGGVCRFLSPLAGAAWVAHRPLVKRPAIAIGSGMRFQVLGMALAALLLPVSANLSAFFVFYCIFNLLNGMQSVIYGLLMAKVIPLSRRGRFVGLRDFTGGATAAGVAWLAGSFFQNFRFPTNYGATYLVAFGFTSLGLLCFSAIREPRSPFTDAPRSLVATIATVPALMRADRRFAWYLVARSLGALGLMTAPYFVIATGGALGGVAALGHVSVAYFVANTLANLLWGQLADRGGFRVVFLAAAGVWVGALAFAFGAPATLESALVLFALVGAGHGGLQMASLNMVYEFGDAQGLGVRLAVVNALGELMVAIGPLLGGVIADRYSYDILYVVAVVFTGAAMAVMYWRVQSSRRAW